MANDGKVKIGTELDKSGLEKGMSGIGGYAKKGFSVLGSAAVAASKLAASALTAAAGSIGTGFGAAVKVGSEFEAEMSKVSAISGAVGEDFDRLTEKAKEMGAKTMFSASESAQAMEYMAMAGWKTADMLDGIEGIMNLAAASGEDLATTSDIVTDALTAFGLSAQDSTHFADVLAAASSNANTNVSLMGETFKYVAPVAGALGFSAEDAAVAIGLMANAGIKGSQAGTALRSMMSRLAKPTAEVETAMSKLGLSLTDSEGNMKSLDAIMQDLRQGFSGLSEAESANVAASLAGQEAMSGLLAIVSASDDDFEKLRSSIYECDGASAAMAETMQNNLQGQITILKSSLEGLGIEIYESVQEPLTGFAQLGIDAVNDLTEAFKADGASGLVAAGGKLIADLITGAIQQLPSLISMAAQLIGSIASGLKANLPQILSSGKSLVSSLTSGIISSLPEIVASGIRTLEAFIDYLIDNLPQIIQTGGKMLAAITSGIVQELPNLIAKIPSLCLSIIKGFLNEDWAYVGVNIINGIIGGLLGAAQGLVQAAVNAAKSALSAMKRFLGIRSPSRLMRDVIGKNMIAGVGEGIVKETPSLEDASEWSATKAVESMQGAATRRSAKAGMELSERNIPKGNPDPGESDGPATIKRIIEVPVNIEGREIARATAEYTDEQMEWEEL